MKQIDRIAKREETDRAAYEILDKEASAREQKTDRLRKLRMSRETENDTRLIATKRPERPQPVKPSVMSGTETAI